MVIFTCLGSGREVGRSAILVETQKGKERFLMDYGLEVQHLNIPSRPPSPLDGIFLSHAHLDHSGMMPLLYKRGTRAKTYSSSLTFDLCTLLLDDSIKVQKKCGLVPFFLESHVDQFLENCRAHSYGTEFHFREAKATLLDAGHVPGSCSILLETGGKRILYTGDINLIDTKLVNGARNVPKNLDAIICESTYAERNHPDREKLEDQLEEKIQEIHYSNGHVILPSFAIGRTQELLIMLYELGFPIYLDGMGIKATDITLRHPHFLRHPQKLKKAFSYAHKIRDKKGRENALKRPSIIITTAGMLNGGPVHYYIKKLWNRPDCSLLLTGYQVEDTTGRRLLDTGRFRTADTDLKLRMHYEYLDFSAHADRDHLLQFLEKASPKKVILVHGSSTPKFAEELKRKGFDAVAPKNGERIVI